MTAEVVVMNTLAVAAAADSAVTITLPQGQKIYQSANKLFALTKHAPVGIMIYGTADFMGVPWENVVKTYRHDLARRTFPTLDEYVAHFLASLERNRRLFPQRNQALFVEQESRSYLTLLAIEIREALKSHFHGQTGIAESAIARFIDQFMRTRRDQLRSLPPADALPRSHPSTVIRRYKTQLNRAVATVWQGVPLSSSSRASLLEILGEVQYRRIHGIASGIVIMGLGDQDVFPSAVEYLLRGIVADKLWKFKNREQHIGGENSAAIIPFAQSEMVGTFMEGIDPDLSDFLMGMFGKLLTGYIDQVADALPSLPDTAKGAFRDRAKAICDDQMQQLKSGFDQYRHTKHVSPIMNMISALPKHELARVAEALVNLTSFKRRVSDEPETVAEPVDVAVISRGDGFVWVKRKHYFPSEINPGWPSSR